MSTFIRHSDFGFDSGFGFRHSDFSCAREEATNLNLNRYFFSSTRFI